MIWTPEKDQELLAEIAKRRKEKGITQAIREAAERMGITPDSASSRFYKLQKRLNDANEGTTKGGHEKAGREETVGEEKSLQDAVVGGLGAENRPSGDLFSGANQSSNQPSSSNLPSEKVSEASAEDLPAENLPVEARRLRSLLFSKPWTPEEDAVLLKGVAEGKSFDEIAASLSGRTAGAAKLRYKRLNRKINAQAQANVQKYRAYNQVDALNLAYKLLKEESRTTNDGRLDYQKIERIALLTGLPYAKVLSLWGSVNRPGFWSMVELHKLEDIVDSQKIQIELFKQELKERAEEMDRYVNRAEKVKAVLRAKLAESHEALAEQKKQYEVLLVVTRSLQRFAKAMNSWVKDDDFKLATKIEL